VFEFFTLKESNKHLKIQHLYLLISKIVARLFMVWCERCNKTIFANTSRVDFSKHWL